MVAGTGDGVGPPNLPPEALERLDPEELRTLAYASAIGLEFDFDLLVEALGADPEQLAERVERLVDRGLLRERSGGGRFAFVDDNVRAEVYRSMTESRLRVIHLKIAQTLERHLPDPPDAVLAELGRHYFLGKTPEKAWKYNRRAAEISRSEHRLEAAIHHLERARRDLASLPGNHLNELAEIDEELGNLHRNRGRPDAAEEAYLQALNRLAPGDRQARARLLLARAEMAHSVARRTAAHGMGEEALEIAQEIGDLRGQAAAHRVRARMAFERGEFITALDEQMVALDYLQQAGDPIGLGECCTDIALTFSVLGPAMEEDAIRWYRRGVEILEGTEARWETARALANLGIAVGRTDPLGALEWLERSRATSEQISAPHGVVMALLRGIEFQVALGQVAEAERAHAQAVRLLERIIDPRGTQLAAFTRGLIAERRGQWEEAELAYREAAAHAERLGLVAENAVSEFHLARLLYKTRDLSRAREALHRVEQLDLPRLRPAFVGPVQELAAQLRAAGPTGEPPRSAPPGAGI
jgi:tetratricopeptide (TPR) repeat protein